jgi:dihydrolipoamide dehydrogenase
MDTYDVAVIGSGPGGFTAAVRAAQLGAKVIIIEKFLIGGTCLNCGCIPTKFLWQSLKTKQTIQKSYEYGLKATLYPVIFSDVIAKKNRNVSNIRNGMKIILSSYAVDIIKGCASFKNKNTLVVSNGEKSTILEVSAVKIIIATGTSPSVVENFVFDGDKIINSTDLLNLEQIPKNMLIIGGGAIGIELATIFSGFGCHVTLVERENRILPGEDSEISGKIKKNLFAQGVDVLTGCISSSYEINKYEKVLIVTGRVPNNDLDYENVGIKTTKRGFVEVNEFCQTNVDNVYAVGDITGENLLAYTAQNEGSIAAENAVDGNFIAINNSVIPQIVFSMPQSASVKIFGFSRYKNVIFGKFPFTANSRAFIECERKGFVKCAVDEISKKPLAFWIIGQHSDELANIASQILKNNVGAISRETFFHPSISESLLNAYDDALGKCTDLPKKGVNKYLQNSNCELNN